MGLLLLTQLSRSNPLPADSLHVSEVRRRVELTPSPAKGRAGVGYALPQVNNRLRSSICRLNSLGIRLIVTLRNNQINQFF